MALRLAIFGQAPFGAEVTERLAAAGHEIAVVYAPPDVGRPDPLGVLAQDRGWPLLRHKFFRRKGVAKPEIVEEYRSFDVDLNVLPFTTAILPPEITDAPPHGSLCFHPSLLPAYRGGAALSWQIILGAEESGVSVFKVTDGVDAGPLVVQRGGVPVTGQDTMGTLYFDKLYGLGVEAMVDAVEAVADATAHYVEQDEAGASEQGLVNDEVARIDWSEQAVVVDRKVRGCDPSPGAIAQWRGEPIRLFGSKLEESDSQHPPGQILAVRGGALHVACGRGSVSVAKARGAEGKKGAAAELGASEDDRLH
ncbi:MAG: methionyl-tRNA formyltransferase [bacterium]|nr:methionyl-tRNA formyltransferase [bacterium]